MTDPQDPFAPPPAGQEPPAGPYGQPPAPPAGPPQPPPYGAPPYGAPQYGAPYGGPAGPPRKNGMGVAALVLGIASLVVPCLWLLAIPAVLAIVFGVQGRKRAKLGQASNGGVATAGLVTGIISLVLGALVWVFIAVNVSHFRDWVDCVDAAAGDTVSEEACNDQLRRDLGAE